MGSNLRLLATFTLFAVAAASSVGWFSYLTARRSLEDAAQNALTLGRETKRRQVENLFAALRQEILMDARDRVPLQKAMPHQNPEASAPDFLTPQHLGVTHRWLLSCEGSFSSFPEEAAAPARTACASSTPNATFLSDIIPWNHGHPSSFLWTAVPGGSHQVLGYAFSALALNRIMLAAESWTHEGFGLSGETYIVGSDLRMRTDSRFAIENLSDFLLQLTDRQAPKPVRDAIRATHSTVLALAVDTPAAREALAGRTGTRIQKDYRDVRVLSSYTPLHVPGVHWALLSERDFDEAFEPVARLRSNLLLFTGMLALVFLFLGSLLTRAVATPLDRLARQALGISEGLQRRIGNDLHDSLAQQLVAMSILAKTAANDIRRHGDATDVDRIAALADDAVKTARELARGLSPVPVLQHGLTDALSHLVHETEKRAAPLRIHLSLCDTLPPPQEEEALHLYRMVQEAINNAIRHGRAQTISVVLQGDKNIFHLTIANDGSPFSLPEDGQGMGLAILAMRCRALNGTFGIGLRSDGWTEVRCHHLHLRRLS